MVNIANKNYTCPSCGAPIKLQSVNTKIVTCTHCDSMLSLEEEILKSTGLKSMVLKDTSELQINTRGNYDNKEFTIIGRIQVGYEYGFWNEWFLQFDTGNNAWLTDTDSGSYITAEISEENIEFIQKLFSININPTQKIELPHWKELQVNQLYSIYNRNFLSVDITENNIVGIEGELPKNIKIGDSRKSLDLRFGKGFVTVDYTNEESSNIYIGKYDKENIKYTNTKSILDIENNLGYNPKEMRTISCPNCGDNRQKALPGTNKIICSSCSGEINLTNGQYKALKEDSTNLRFNLDTQFIYRNRTWNVTGIVKKEGSEYSWVEYFLTDSENINNTKWLSETLNYNTFYISRQTNFVPRFTENSIVYNNKSYGKNNCEVYNGQTTCVAGTFNWELNINDSVLVKEYQDENPNEYLVEEITTSKKNEIKRHEEVSFTYVEKIQISKLNENKYSIQDSLIIPDDATNNEENNGFYESNKFYFSSGKVFLYILFFLLMILNFSTVIILGCIVLGTLSLVALFDNYKAVDPNRLTLYRLLTVCGLGTLILLTAYYGEKNKYNGSSGSSSSYGSSWGGGGYSSSGSYSGGSHK